MSTVPWDGQLATAAARLLGEADICGICREPIGNEAKQIDHIAPRARGGRNNLENLQWSHALCNLWKRDRTVWTAADARAWREAATRPRQCGCGRIIRKRSNSCPVRVKVGACWKCHDLCQECPAVWWAQAKCGSCGSSMDDDCARATLAGDKCTRTRERERQRERRNRQRERRNRQAGELLERERRKWERRDQRERKKEQDWERWQEQRRPEWEPWKQAHQAEERQEQNRPAGERPERREERPERREERQEREQVQQASPRQSEPVWEREPYEQRQDRQVGQAAAAIVIGTNADYVPRADGTGLGRTAREQKRARHLRLKWAKRWERIGQHEKAKTLWDSLERGGVCGGTRDPSEPT